MSAIIRMLRALKRETIPFLQMCVYNTLCRWQIELFGKRDKRRLKYEISLCLIFKNEGAFLKEWIDFHRTIGVDHFYLYNNNSSDNFRDILMPYITNGIVSLIEWPYEQGQSKAYLHCLKTYRNESKWISFLDADEFFVPRYELTIGDWLKNYEKYPAVTVHWRMFGTGGQLKHDYTKNVIEQYYSCFDKIYCHGKCLINTRFDIANVDTWYMFHHIYTKFKLFGFIPMRLPAVNQFHKICVVDHIWGGGKNKLAASTMMINHYFTKAWDIYSSKMKKTDGFFTKNPKADYSYFFKYEMNVRAKDYTIQRFFIKMKKNQGIIE